MIDPPSDEMYCFSYLHDVWQACCLGKETLHSGKRSNYCTIYVPENVTKFTQMSFQQFCVEAYQLKFPA